MMFQMHSFPKVSSICGHQAVPIKKIGSRRQPPKYWYTPMGMQFPGVSLVFGPRGGAKNQKMSILASHLIGGVRFFGLFRARGVEQKYCSKWGTGGLVKNFRMGSPHPTPIFFYKETYNETPGCSASHTISMNEWI